MGTISNIACNAFSMRKFEKTEGGYLGTDKNGKTAVVQYNSVLKILKNRYLGNTGEIALQYDMNVRRFTQIGFEPKKYTWLKGLERWETVDGVLDL